MSRRTPETLADYLVVAICPTLIGLLVGSLLYFLVEVFYQGQYQLRLLWVLAMFVLGIVSLARLSMEEGFNYASLYGLPFGIVVGIAIVRFVEFRGPLAPFSLPILWGLMAWVWWCAHKLTWDCTLIDDSTDASGEGLLQQMGLDREVTSTAAPGSPSSPASVEATTSGQPAEVTPKEWWEIWYEAERRPHPPGVWVVYFSLGALPMFGIGGRFIAIDDLASRRWCFWLLVMYVACAMALLLATSFLGLRKYLRQRRLEMPLEMAAAWVGVGAVLIVGTLVVAALVPRPAPEYSLTHLVRVDSPELWASRFGFGPEGGKSKPDNPTGSGASPTRDQQADQQGGQPNSNQTDGPSSDGGKGKGSGKGDGKGQGQGDKSQSGQSQSNPPQQDQSSQQSQASDNSAQQNDSQQPSDSGKQDGGNQGDGKQGTGKQSDNQSDPPKPGEQQGQQSQSEQQGEQSQSATGGDNKNNSPSSQQNQSAADNSSSSAGGSTPTSNPPGQLIEHATNFLGNLGTGIKWLAFLAIAIIAGVLAWRYRAELAAAWQKLLAELAALWPALFGRRVAESTEAPGEAPLPRRPFAEFVDPFASGRAANMSPAEVVRYTFAALEAWGRENGCPRETGQTPHEFAAAIGQLDHTLAGEAAQLADVYARMAYARPAAIRTSFEPLRALWRKMSTPAITVVGA